jgi:hypothetical protein
MPSFTWVSVTNSWTMWFISYYPKLQMLPVLSPESLSWKLTDWWWPLDPGWGNCLYVAWL